MPGQGRLRPAGRSVAVPGGFLRRMPAALLLLAAALALLLFGDGGVVQAQGVNLVTNIGQAVHSTIDLANEDVAQEFTTGSNDPGYTLSNISLILVVSAVGNLPAVKLFHTSATGTEVATLTAPTSVTAGQYVINYTPPAHTRLAKETSYWIVVEGGRAGTARNTSTAEDPNPAAGWSIADQQERRAQSSTGAFTVYANRALQIGVGGTITTNTAASGAPAITAPNVFRVPAALGVDLSGITDPEGTTNIADNATYKWQRFDATGDTLETDSIGTASTYTLTDADAGKTLKVVVNFTDDANNSEGPLTSAATPVITAAASCNAPTLVGGATFLGGARKLGVGLHFWAGITPTYGFNDFNRIRGNFGSLDSPAFTTAGSNTYEIDYFNTVNDGSFNVRLDPALSAADKRTVVLHVCDEAVAFGPLTEVQDQGSAGAYYWVATSPLDLSTHAERTIYLSQDTAASGAPAITAPNVFRVPAALGVDLSGIYDAHGTTNIADNATYKWQRFDATGDTLETDSIGTDSTYTLTDADAGKTLKVVVNFTDDDNNSEGPLTSAATSAITAAASCNAPSLVGGATFLGGARKLGVGLHFWAGITPTYGFNDFNRIRGNFGSLDSPAFTTAGSNTYEIDYFNTVNDGSFNVRLDPALSAADKRTVVLHVCDEAVAFGPLTEVQDQGSAGAYYWVATSPLDLSTHAERTIYLSQDTAAPTLDSATVDRTSLALTFSEDLGAAASLANGAFTVKKTPRNAAQTTLTLDSGAPPSITGSTVTLTLDSASSVKEADTNVLVSYTSPTSGSANKLVDKFGNEAAFTDAAVDNTTVNTAPTANNNTVTMNEDATEVFGASQFGYLDSDDDALASVKITVLPETGKGTLTLDGTAITGTALPQTVTAVELADDKLIYTPPVNANGTPYTTFNFKVNDGTVDSAEYTMTINITGVDDPGTVSITGTLLGGSTLTATVSDPDGNVTNASWRWMRGDTDAGTFSNISGATAANYDLVAADVGKYLKAMVSYTDGDGSGKSATSDPSGQVGASNAEPAFSSATATRTLPENSGAGTDVVGGAITATDTDGDTLIYGLKNTGNHASFTIVSSSGQIQAKTGITYNFEGSKKTYTVTVTVHDSKDIAGHASTVVDDEIAVTINLTDENEAPTITGGPTSRSVPENSTAVATYTASDVDASDTLTWSVESADDGSFFEISSGGALSFANAPDFEDKQDAGADNVYNVTVSVTDAGGMSATRAVAVTVTNINEAPEITTVLSTYTAFNVDENTGTAVVIKTYEATDVDASTTLTWSLEGNDSGDFTITTNTQGQGELKFARVPNHEIPADADTMNDYDVTVKVRDNHSGQLSDTLRVSVTVDDVNEAPVITSPPATRSVPENSTAVVTFSATDVDASDMLTWSVESADDGGKFTIDPSSGVLTFTNAPDFETPTDTGDTAMNNTYVLTVKVEDNGSPAMSDTHTVTVTVTNINEAPEITTDSPTYTAFNVDENTATSVVIQTYEATDVDANSVLTWSLEGDDLLDFTITKNAQGHGELKFANVPNYEMAADADTMNDYDVTVKVRDNHTGQLSDTLTVTVTVDDVNETPEVSGNAGPSFMEIEFDVLDADLTTMDYEIGTYTAYDDDADTVAWSVSGTDSTHFAIDPMTGVLSFSIRPDFENPVADSGNTYVIVVEANDGNGGVGTFDVTVTVTNVNETPEITSNNATQTFDEIEYDATTADLVVDTFTGRDEETETITWSLVGTDAGDFSINSASGLLSFSRRPNYEMPADNGMDNVYDIIVRARDTNNNTRDYPVTVTVMNVNERPDITENFPTARYMEIEYDFTGTRPGVHTFSATDYDAGDTFTWTLAGTDAEHLEIDPSSGALTFTQDLSFGRGPLPNYEYPRDDSVGGSSNTYSITVVATDSLGEPAEYAVVVTVTDVNEQPGFTGTPAVTVDVDEHDVNREYVVMDLADYDARDEEGGVTWSLTGPDSGDFAISADGVVTFRATPNFEAPADSGGDNVYNVTVVARDTASGSTRRTVSAAVTVTVADVEEDGKIEVVNLNLDPVVGEIVSFMLSDPDGGISSIEWRVQLRDPDPNPDVGWASEPSDGTNTTTFRYLVDEDHAGKEMRAYVAYSDLRGSGKTATSQGTAAITANPTANAKPRFRGRSTRSIPEGGVGRDVGVPVEASDRDRDTLTFGIGQGGDSAYFAINPSTGQIRTTQALDYETIPGLKFLFVTVTLHDGKGVDPNNMVISDDSVDATTTIAITITDMEEDGVVTFSSSEPEVGTSLQATLADSDDSVSGEMWQWARSENGRTGWTNISGETLSNYTPTEADEDFYLRASVTYADGRGGGKSAEAVTSAPVPSENRRPLFPTTEDGQRTVAENTRAGVNIGAPVAAVDPENDRLTYALSGTDAGAFTINTSTGQLRTKEALDFETTSTYSVTVEVHDGRDGSGNPSTSVDDTQDVTITIENVEEQGVVTLTTLTGVIQARVVVTAELEDDDRPTGVSWQWSQSPNGRTDWVNIGTGDTYTTTLADAGKYIRATASYTDGHGSNKTALKVSPRVGRTAAGELAAGVPTVGERSARGGGERRRRHDHRGSCGRHRCERRRPGRQRPSRLFSERDGRRILRDRCEHRATAGGFWCAAGLRGQGVVPRHGASHRRQGPERRR